MYSEYIPNQRHPSLTNLKGFPLQKKKNRNGVKFPPEIKNKYFVGSCKGYESI